MSSSRAPGSTQGATVGVRPTPTPQDVQMAPEELSLGYLEQLAGNLTVWQQIVFNSADGGNRTGLKLVANEIQQASYRLRLQLGHSTIDAKLGAGLPLTLEENEVVREHQEVTSRKAAVAEFQRGLQH